MKKRKRKRISRARNSELARIFERYQSKQIKDSDRHPQDAEAIKAAEKKKRKTDQE